MNYYFRLYRNLDSDTREHIILPKLIKRVPIEWSTGASKLPIASPRNPCLPTFLAPRFFPPLDTRQIDNYFIID